MSFGLFWYTARNPSSAIDESMPPKPSWGVNQIPDLTGKVYIVTGGNSGIGYETVKALLSKNGKVYLCSRSERNGREAIQRLKEETGQEAHLLRLDLSDLHDVKRAVQEFLEKENQLHVLFNNAGVMIPPKDQATAQGWDLQFGVNTLAHFMFTQLLLPTMIETAKTLPAGQVRVVNTSSVAHVWYPHIHFDGLKKGEKKREQLCEAALYGQSKIAMVMWTKELSYRYHDSTGIVFTSLNPGSVGTNLQQHVKGNMSKWLHPPPLGALTQLWAGVSVEGKDFDGKYLKPWARIGKAHSNANDKETSQKLWEFMESATREYL